MSKTEARGYCVSIRWILAVTISLMWSVPAPADTIVIKFRSGKTQEVTLTDKAVNVEGIQLLSVPQREEKTMKPAGPGTDRAAGIRKDAVKEKDANNSENHKEGIRLKWAPPQFGE